MTSASGKSDGVCGAAANREAVLDHGAEAVLDARRQLGHRLGAVLRVVVVDGEEELAARDLAVEGELHGAAETVAVGAAGGLGGHAERATGVDV